jgi:hypothetical protein
MTRAAFSRSHPDRVRRHYDPDSVFPVDTPNNDSDADDLPLDDADVSEEDTAARSVDGLG